MFDKLTRFLIVILPFNVIITVFFQYKLGIGGFGAYKEILIILLVASLVYEFIKIKKFPRFEVIDYLIFVYIAYLLVISFANKLPLKTIFYGGRYDFEFLIIFLVFRHGSVFLKEKISYYLRLFLYSGGIAIFLGLLVRFVFGETILLYFGFSANLSNWDYGGSIPIFHGIEGASVRRFQGIFDGPNQAAFFLILFLGVFFHYYKNKKEHWWIMFPIIFLILGLVFLTYCRSSLLGIIIAGFVMLSLNIKHIIKKYKAEIFIVAIIFLFLGFALFLRYGDNLKNIVMRSGSSKGHYERMIMGINKFKQKPLGHGLASSGPAYRATHDIKGISEETYIPESWYVQQLVEGGVIGFFIFLLIMLYILLRTYHFSIALFGSFLAVLTMNSLLHSFESMYASILLFMFLGIFDNLNRQQKKIR